jgi:hypothetical protein
MVHPPPQTDAEQQPETDTEYHLTAQRSSQGSEESPVIVHSPPQINTEQQPQTVRGPPQIAEEPPAMVHPLPQISADQEPETVSTEDLETDDIVIAYVIQLSTVTCLT